MYKVFLKYPESLRPAFPRLKEKLEDPDPGVEVFHTALFIYLLEMYQFCYRPDTTVILLLVNQTDFYLVSIPHLVNMSGKW